MATGGDIAELFGWTWWETGLWENRRGGVLTFESTITETFARALMEGQTPPPMTAPETSRDLRHRVEQLKEQIERLQEAPDPLRSSMQTDHRAGPVLSQLTQLVTEMQRAEDRDLAALPLLESKIDVFASGAMAAWSSSRHLRKLGSTARWDPEHPRSAEPTGFGINRLVPKDYFVEQPGVFADPAELGRELGDAVGRGEDELIVEVLRGSLTSRTVSLDQIAIAVMASARDLSSQGCDPSVLVVNSWDILEALGPVTDRNSRLPVADVEDSVRLKDSSVLVLLRYVGTGSFCVVADLAQAFEVTSKDPVVERPDDRVEDTLLVGVERIDLGRARELVDADPAFRRAHGSEMSVEDAVLDVQKSAHVRILEWISVEAGPQVAGVIFEVDGAR